MTPWRLARRAAVVVALLIAVQAAHVLHTTGQLRLWPSAAPPTLTELGRLYHRSDATTPVRAPHGVRRVGTTSGGGDVLAPRLDALQVRAHAVPTVIWVRDGSGHVWTYELSGGP